MKAVQFVHSVPRFLLTKAIGELYPPIRWSGLSCVRFGEIAPPQLPGQRWVLMKTILGGICGSDVNAVLLRESLSLQPFASFPHVMGHEILGQVVEVGEEVEDLQIRDRVVVNPALHCLVRGFAEPCPACQRGDQNVCERMTEGDIGPGLFIGVCRDTGGGWGEYLVAHDTQCYRVADQISDECAILVEPLAIALHAALRNWPDDAHWVLVMGCGVAGICLIAALRALGSKARIVAVARHPFQGNLAQLEGADHIVYANHKLEHYDELARTIGGKLFHPVMSKPVLVGGADIVFECVGSDASIDDSLRLCRSGGRVVVVGTTSIPRSVDWSPIWLNQLEIRGTYGYSTDWFRDERQSTFQIALTLLDEGKLDLAPLLTHRFPLASYRKALGAVTGKARSQVVKAAFAYP